MGIDKNTSLFWKLMLFFTCFLFEENWFRVLEVLVVGCLPVLFASSCFLATLRGSSCLLSSSIWIFRTALGDCLKATLPTGECREPRLFFFEAGVGGMESASMGVYWPLF